MLRATIDFHTTSGRRTCRRVIVNDDKHLSNVIKFLEKKYDLRFDDCWTDEIHSESK
jgi:hypothetical protein